MRTTDADGPGAAVRPSWIDSGRVPGLDGLRAVAVVLVISAHAASTIARRNVSRTAMELGSLGVDVFFVISGFLITLLLLREHSRAGRLSLRAFYVRRVLRIWPAYLAYLGFMAIVWRRGMTSTDWWASLAYVTNFLSSPAWSIAHTWSLSVEEHFYLLWPAALAILGRSAPGLLIAVVAVGPVVRVVVAKAGLPWLQVMVATPTRIDTIAAGCLLAYLVASPRGQGLVSRLSRRPGLALTISVAVILVSKVVLSRSTRYWISLDRTVVAVALCVAVLSCASAPRSSIGRVLGSKPMIAIGVLSYSLYLWQQPFLDHDSPAWICRFPQNLILAVACAVACHHLVERPFLRLKDRMGRVRHG